MKRKSKNMQATYKQWNLLFFILLLIWIILMSFIVSKNESKKKQYLEIEMDSFSSKIISTLRSYEQFSNYIFYESIDNEEVLELIDKAYNSNENQREKLKKELFSILNSKYKNMEFSIFDYLTIIFPTGEAFFTYNFSENSDENNFKFIRKNQITNTGKRFVEAFEKGNFFGGYRYIYLTVNKGKYMGVVEISIPLESLVKNFSIYYPNVDLTIAFRDNIVSKKIGAYQSIENLSFIPSRLLSYEEIFVKEKNKKILEKNKKIIVEKIQKEESLGLIEKIDGENYTSLFIAIKNSKEDTIGYLVGTYESNQYNKLLDNFNTEITLVNLIILVSLVATFIFVRDKNRFQKLSYTDYLTTLNNRVSFSEIANIELERSIRYGHCFSILLIDIDYFKKVNDTYGHNKGDEILKNLSLLIKDNLRKNDIIARWGGEEFICLLPETNRESAVIVAEKLRITVEQYSFEEVDKVTISIGVYEKMWEFETLEEIIDKADIALYKAKSLGRNRVFCGNTQKVDS